MRLFRELREVDQTSGYLFALGLIVRFGYSLFLLARGGIELVGGADHSQYEALAINLATHHVFSLSTVAPFIPDALRTPGYPLFLAVSYLLTGGFVGALFLQIVLGATMPVFIRLIGIRLGLSSRWATLAAVLGLCDLNFLSNTANLQTEGLFMPLMVATLWYWVRSLPHMSVRRGGIIAILFGILTLIRPVWWYVGGALLVVLVLQYGWGSLRRILVMGSVVGGLCLLTVSPWLLRNHALFGNYDLASIGPVNLYTRLAVSVLAVENRVPFPEQYRTSLHTLARQGAIPDASYPEQESVLYDIRYNDLFTHETLQVIREHPRAFMKLQLISVLTILTHDNTLNVLQAMQIAPLAVYPPFSVSFLFLTTPFPEFMHRVGSVVHGWYLIPYVGRAWWLCITLAAFYGVWVLAKRPYRAEERQALGIIIVLILVHIIVTLPVGFSIDARMRVPIEPYLLLLASAGGAAVLQWRPIARYVKTIPR